MEDIDDEKNSDRCRMLVFGRPCGPLPARSLEKRIADFIRAGDHTEDLDGPAFADFRKVGRIADFLAWNRALVVELKAPKADPRARLGSIVSRAMAQEPRMFAFGTIGVEAILRQRPNGEEVNRTMLANGTRHVRQLLQRANRQIMETKEKLNLPCSAGVVVMPVEVSQPLEVGVVAHAIRHALEAQTNRLSHVNFVWASFEAHEVRLQDGSHRYPELFVWRNKARPSSEWQLIITMLDAWAQSSGGRLDQVDHSRGWEALKPHGEGWPLQIDIDPR